MSIESPRINKRSSEDLLKEIKSLVPFYSPEWKPSENDAGLALIKIFSQMLETVTQRLNRVPEKNFAAFLDTLGINLLPSQPATAPITFSLSGGTGEHVLIPAKTQVSAGEVIFETKKNIFATPSRLIKAYSIDVEDDEIYKSPANVLSGETVESLQTELLYNARQENKQIFVSRSKGLNEGDIIIIGKGKIKEYGIVSKISDSRVILSHKLKYGHNANCSVEKVTSFNLLEGKNIQGHMLYLGHDDLFNIKSETSITIIITNSESAVKLVHSRIVQWEYWGEAIRTEGAKKLKEIDWHPLNVVALEDNRRQRFRLQKEMSGEIKELEVNKIKSRWIRCRVKDTRKIKDIELDTIQIGEDSSIQEGLQFGKLPSKAIRGIGKMFSEKLAKGGINTVEELLAYRDRVDDLAKIIKGKEKSFKYYREQAENILENAQKRVLDEQYERAGDTEDVTQGIFPDMAFCNDVPIDLTRNDTDDLFKTSVFPFGRIPRLYDTCYIASQEAFSKKGAEICLNVTLAKGRRPAPSKDLCLSWEYWNGDGWVVIKDIDPSNYRFYNTGTVCFDCPEDIRSTKVNGHEDYWIRVRIVSGDYGRETYQRKKGNPDKDGIDQEWWERDVSGIKAPTISKLAITYTPGSQPPQHCLTYNNLEFKDVTEESKNRNKSFKPFEQLEDVRQALYLGFDKRLEKGPISIFFSLEEQEFTKKELPKIEWLYFSQDRKWVKLDVLDNTQGFIRTGTVEFLIPADFAKTSKFGAEIFWIKAVDIEDGIQKPLKMKGIYINATYAIQEESIEDEILGSSDLSQNQKFQFIRVPIIKEEIWVNEIATLPEEKKKTIIKQKGKDFILESKSETGETTEVWVRWEAVEDFFESSSKSRHYSIDRIKWEIKFGDGIRGMIPPFGNIKASYKVGGGKKGNVGAQEISDLKTSIPYVDAVSNPEPALGGSDIEQMDVVLERGPYLIKHRDRAVTEEDFERIAKTASSYITRTKCLVENNKLKIIVIPEGKEEKPTPSSQLLYTVKRYLLKRALNLIIPESIEVQKPEYREININVYVVPESIDRAIPLEKEILRRLKEFLHPLTGGAEKRGWEFGRDVHISDVYALIEGINGVDHIEDLYLNGRREDVEVNESETVCSGEHSITMKFGG